MDHEQNERQTRGRPQRRLVAFCLCTIFAIIWFVPAIVEFGEFDKYTYETTFGDKVRKQEESSFGRILGNIGPQAGAKEGLVVASRSHGEPDQPDYFVC